MKKDESRLGKGLGAIFGEALSNVIEEKCARVTVREGIVLVIVNDKVCGV